jgi:hypothetical protein
MDCLFFCFLELLWVAPELILSTVVPGNPATQKGDVYSFAIILEEIVVRGGPFEAARQFLEPQGGQPDKILNYSHYIVLHLAEQRNIRSYSKI